MMMSTRKIQQNYTVQLQVIHDVLFMFSFTEVSIAIFSLPGCTAAVVSAHQLVELPTKPLTQPWN